MDMRIKNEDTQLCRACVRVGGGPVHNIWFLGGELSSNCLLVQHGYMHVARNWSDGSSGL